VIMARCDVVVGKMSTIGARQQHVPRQPADFKLPHIPLGGFKGRQRGRSHVSVHCSGAMSDRTHLKLGDRTIIDSNFSAFAPNGPSAQAPQTHRFRPQPPKEDSIPFRGNHEAKQRGARHVASNMPGYTGHHRGLQQQYGATYGRSIAAAPTALLPAIRQNLHTPCSIPPRKYYLKGKESSSNDGVLMRNKVNIMLGDERFCDMSSQSTADFAGGRVIADEKPKPAEEDLRRMYAQAVTKVTDERLVEISEQLKEKIAQRSRAGGSGGMYVLRSAFKYFDRDGSGGLDYEELKDGLEMFGMQIEDHEILALMAKLDHDYEYEIQYEDFLDSLLSKNEFAERKSDLRNGVTAMLKRKNGGKPVTKQDQAMLKDLKAEVTELFHSLDTKNRGRLDRDQVEHLITEKLGIATSREQTQVLFLRMDKNHSGLIDVEEFWLFFQNYCIP